MRARIKLIEQNVILEESFLHPSQALESKNITTKIAFVVDPSGSVPEGTTTKLIFIMMGVQAGMDIHPE